jgi:hypothetical protein
MGKEILFLFESTINNNNKKKKKLFQLCHWLMLLEEGEGPKQ